MNSTVVARKKQAYAQLYKKSWQSIEEFTGWLCESRKGPRFAYCLICDKHMNIASGKSVLLRHAKAFSHCKRALTFSMPDSSSDFLIKKFRKLSEISKQKDILITMNAKESAKKQAYAQNYKKSWENIKIFKGWLFKSTQGPNFAYCLSCDKHMNIARGRSMLLRHCKSRSHCLKFQEKGLPDLAGGGLKEENTIKMDIEGFVDDDGHAEPGYENGTEEGHEELLTMEMQSEGDAAAKKKKRRAEEQRSEVEGRLQAPPVRRCDEFDLFCQSLAVQLKEMPLHRALLCQEKLQSVMVRERLSQLMGTEGADSALTANHSLATEVHHVDPVSSQVVDIVFK